jgi:integrase
LRATKTARAADDAKARLDNHVLNHKRLAGTELSKLAPAHLETWRTALKEAPTRGGNRRGERRSDSTLNRDMTCLRAALNRAYIDGLVTSDFAWRSKLLPLKNADRRRELYLDRDQRRSFLEKAAPDLAAFLRGLCLLPLRPGALAALTAGDYDSRLKVLKVFTKAAKDKLPGAPLLSRVDGKAWNKDSWKWPVKAAAEAAKLPAGATAYTLRHSVISDLVHGGLDLLTVAQLSGTSVAMIEKHYGHLRSDIAAAALAKLAL